VRFASPRKPRPSEAIVPMINIVFLLLIFFMMTARIAPPPPFDLTLPDTDRETDLEETATLYVSAEGLAGFGGVTGDAAWARLAAAPVSGSLTVRADAALPAKELASILTRLAQAGIEAVELAVAAP